MIERVLGEADAPAFHALRRRALCEHPEAFGMSPDEIDTVAVVAERFRADPGTAPGFVMVDQVNARRLYRSLGFAVVGVKHRRIRVGDRYYDEEHMELRLR